MKVRIFSTHYKRGFEDTWIRHVARAVRRPATHGRGSAGVEAIRRAHARHRPTRACAHATGRVRRKGTLAGSRIASTARAHARPAAPGLLGIAASSVRRLVLRHASMKVFCYASINMN
jgi:hypothetical protein